MTEPAEPILQFFEFEHLPPGLQHVSAPFAALASRIVHTLPRNAERSTALRKLLEAKDAAVRAAIARPVSTLIAGEAATMPERTIGPVGISGPVALSDCQHPPPNTARNEDPNEGK
jgi:hypothetical protein